MTTHAKVALITGAARGIGLATTEILLERGWQVAMVDRDAPALSEAASGLQGVHPIVADVSIPAEVDAMRDAALSRFGRVDGLVNNAGVALFARAPQTDFEAWREVMATNLDGVFLCTQALVPALAETRGAIVNIASISGLRASTLRVAYGTSKAAVIHLTKQFAAELGEQVVTVPVKEGLSTFAAVHLHPAEAQRRVVRYIGTFTPASWWAIRMPSATRADSKVNEQPITNVTRSSRHTSSRSVGRSVSTPSRYTTYCGTSVRTSPSSAGPLTSPASNTPSSGRALGLRWAKSRTS